MDHLGALLAAYDEQLRTDAETSSAVSVAFRGPVHLATFGGGRGHVTYRDLGTAGPDAIDGLVREALAYYGADPEVTEVEWKTRGHDHAPGLHDSLLRHGFVPGEPESIMIGRAESLAVHVPLLDGVVLRQIRAADDVRAMSAMAAEVFGDSPADGAAEAEALMRRLGRDDGMELWVAEARGQVISGGRLEPVDGTAFAGIWGGFTLPEWRGRGIYRALTAARAASALRLGKTLVHSDSTGYSRPILERSGLHRVSTTTPYLWRR
ncbi:GNAT family N-acetyltransferase [Nocardioides campestrisoli]|uniref:GNAT family N-acetyltransferase n=1 Tax=Nocardioides campestrisoli TaxID=2736757 RepID=UPI00163D4C99|nr:GNAT family N-acetyltransferase [Nocardioides campestrisoli]